MALQDLTPQLRTRLRRVEKIVGLFVAVATLLLIVGFGYYIYHTAQRKGWFIEKCPFFTFVMNGEGLNVGDPVVMMGFNVGDITSITAQPPGSYYKVYIGFQIRRPYYGYIWSDSTVKITASGLLGGRRSEVVPGVAGEPTVFESGNRISELLIHGRRKPLAQVRKGVFLKPEEEPSINDRAQKMLDTVEKALPNILALTNQLNTVLTNTAALTANANGLVTEARPAVSNLTVRLDATLLAANTNLVTLAGDLDQTLINLAGITSNLNAQVQSNDQILSQISRAIVDADNLVQGLKKTWLLRGVFEKMNATNAPPAKAKTR